MFTSSVAQSSVPLLFIERAGAKLIRVLDFRSVLNSKSDLETDLAFTPRKPHYLSILISCQPRPGTDIKFNPTKFVFAVALRGQKEEVCKKSLKIPWKEEGLLENQGRDG